MIVTVPLCPRDMVYEPPEVIAKGLVVVTVPVIGFWPRLIVENVSVPTWPASSVPNVSEPGLVSREGAVGSIESKALIRLVPVGEPQPVQRS